MDILHGLNRAIHAAAQVSKASQGYSLAKGRSNLFVYQLANHFRAHYAKQPGVAVFSKAASWHQAMFGVNEFLFDISVLEYGTIQAVRHAATIPYVTRATWLVESEFGRNSRDILHDLSKLKIGEAESKLFVACEFKDVQRQLSMLEQAAAGISGTLFLALLPPPLDWQSQTRAVSSYRLSGTGWVQDNLAVC